MTATSDKVFAKKNPAETTPAPPSSPMYYIYGTQTGSKKREEYLHVWVGDDHDVLGRTKTAQREYVTDKLRACIVLWEDVHFVLVLTDTDGTETVI